MSIINDNIFTEQSRPVIISYRDFGDNCSQFINVDTLLLSSDIKKMHSVYNYLLRNIYLFESSSIDTLDKLNIRLYHRIIELVDRDIQLNFTSGWKGALFSIRLIVVNFLFGKNKRIRSETDSIRDNLDAIIALKKKNLLQKDDFKTPKAINDMLKLRIEDSNSELHRLRSIKQIDASISRVIPFLTQEKLLCFAHSLELQDKLKDDYYVINHAQAFEMMFATLFAKKMKQVCDHGSYNCFEIMRHDVFFKKHQHTNIDDIRHRRDINDTEPSYRVLLLSGDICLGSTTNVESALSYFKNNTNNFRSYQVVIKAISEYYLTDCKGIKILCELVDKLYARCLKEAGGQRTGSLCSICIPKEQFWKIGYLSKPFGVPYTGCNTNLETLQTSSEPNPPQVRLFTPELTQENGVFILRHTPLNPTLLQTIENEIDLLIRRALMQFRI